MKVPLDPNPNTSRGAVLCTVLGGLILEIVLTVTHHVYLGWR